MLLNSLLLLAATAQASVLTLHAPRVTIYDSNGEGIRTEVLKLVEKPKIPLAVGLTDSLKLVFQIIEEGDTSGKGVQPLQTFLRFYDPETGEEGIQPLRVTPAGKSKFELNMAKPPLSIPPTTSTPLQVTLIIGAHKHTPLKIELFDLVLPESHPVAQHPDEASFHLLPAIHHTFRAPQKVPPRPISALFAALTLSPWAVLIALWIRSQVFPSVPHLFSPSILPFTASLGAFELLLFWYWVDLKLGQVLLYGGVLGVVTIFTGKTALASIGARRVARK
ncbi:Dolichyl-diphosphooligosaccharide--protein glycosyltransferase subunit Swp1 [Mycena maculata]|uniref:Dolichyl-diphosphooligosaccharide--protein glycosyltransferase subunit Swp1 n=1 Tax=Mycena maculata TaxID=230809 RepID=A0AAD7KFH7_9AGAR|nr:Dolichyl-diphosphooligosaccharide--protein glycosyltransferase subunit Swp1 [Mycena maculata]